MISVKLVTFDRVIYFSHYSVHTLRIAACAAPVSIKAPLFQHIHSISSAEAHPIQYPRFGGGVIFVGAACGDKKCSAGGYL